ncbi:hypothetical protein C942_03329 [Photobacterium marinum]|uniref:Uncharacterized protein n=1 Tax=Photobacterium marinum TaxID=1056511 RepID=L8J478_9GAMM|nr:hypothetical protein C942_03329 [Photobacterium marinum]
MYWVYYVFWLFAQNIQFPEILQHVEKNLMSGRNFIVMCSIS